ncbi:MAG: type II toxin-antitoxin system RelE/ParE family toxin [Flavobacteriaceae bacterium]|nr:type II toxin-antitoxin system RelE/ParE family toxin [Flavobacteriaceae bacterium]
METKWSKTAEHQLEEAEIYIDENFSYNEVEHLYMEIERTLDLIAKGIVIHQNYEDIEGLKKVIVAKYNTMVYRRTEKRIEIIAFLNNRKSPEENYKSVKEDRI